MSELKYFSFEVSFSGQLSINEDLYVTAFTNMLYNTSMLRMNIIHGGNYDNQYCQYDSMEVANICPLPWIRIGEGKNPNMIKVRIRER